jgi:hypothetical protein
MLVRFRAHATGNEESIELTPWQSLQDSSPEVLWLSEEVTKLRETRR